LCGKRRQKRHIIAARSPSGDRRTRRAIRLRTRHAPDNVLGTPTTTYSAHRRPRTRHTPHPHVLGTSPSYSTPSTNVLGPAALVLDAPDHALGVPSDAFPARPSRTTRHTESDAQSQGLHPRATGASHRHRTRISNLLKWGPGTAARRGRTQGSTSRVPGRLLPRPVRRRRIHARRRPCIHPRRQMPRGKRNSINTPAAWPRAGRRR
jgi:hypothetical protein